MASSSQNNFKESLDDAFDENFDDTFNQYCDQTFENLTIACQEEASKPRKKRAYIERDREERCKAPTGCLSRGRYLTSLGPHTGRTSQFFALYYNVAQRRGLT